MRIVSYDPEFEERLPITAEEFMNTATNEDVNVRTIDGPLHLVICFAFPYRVDELDTILYGLIELDEGEFLDVHSESKEIFHREDHYDYIFQVRTKDSAIGLYSSPYRVRQVSPHHLMQVPFDTMVEEIRKKFGVKADRPMIILS